jgi:tRNA1(Val) A37 N6-methylase TrmN6
VPKPTGDHTEDALLGGQVRLLQPRKGYRVAIDPVLLAASVSPGVGQTVLDVGSGTGAVSLCLHHRCPEAEIHGLEREVAFLELARQSVELNQAAIVFHEGDLAQWEAAQPGGYDFVLSNPPFWSPENSRPASGLKRAAHFLEGMTLSEWVVRCCAFLSKEGTLSLIVPADLQQEVISGLSDDMGSLDVLPILPKGGQPAKRVLLKAQKGGVAPLKQHPGLVLHREDGSYTERVDGVLRGAKALVSGD